MTEKAPTGGYETANLTVPDVNEKTPTCHEGGRNKGNPSSRGTLVGTTWLDGCVVDKRHGPPVCSDAAAVSHCMPPDVNKLAFLYSNHAFQCSYSSGFRLCRPSPAGVFTISGLFNGICIN